MRAKQHMFLKHIPFAQIRDSAIHCIAVLRVASEKIDSAQWSAVAIQIRKIRERMADAGAVALVVRLDSLVSYLEGSADKSIAASGVASVLVELDHLASGNVLSTLQLTTESNSLRSMTGLELLDEDAFFLPASPIASIVPPPSGEFGSVLQASKDFSFVFSTSTLDLTKDSSNKEALRSVKQVLQALDNRAIGGSIGIAFLFTRAWLDSVSEISFADAKVLNQLSKWLKTCLANEKYVDQMTLSQCAYRVVKTSGLRSDSIKKKFSLDELLASRSAAASAPPIVKFENLWQDCVEKWESYTGTLTRENAQTFLNSLKVLLAAIRSKPSLFNMARGAGLILVKIEGKGFSDAQGAREYVAGVLAVIKTAFDSKDDAFIDSTSTAVCEVTARMLETGLVEKIGNTSNLPAVDFFKEIGKEIEKVVECTAQGNALLAAVELTSVKSYLEVIKSEPGGAALFSTCDRIIDAMQSFPQENYLPALSLLKQSVNIFSQNEPSALALLKDIDALVGRLELQVLMDVDVPSDSEIFEIFYEEAKDIEKQMREICQNSIDSGLASIQDASDVRRHWHTLKGSSRIAGLLHIGDAAYDYETQFNQYLSSGSVPIALMESSIRAVDLLLGLCDTIAETGEVPVSRAAFIRLLPDTEKLDAVQRLAPILSATVDGLKSAESKEKVDYFDPSDAPEPVAALDPDEIQIFEHDSNDSIESDEGYRSFSDTEIFDPEEPAPSAPEQSHEIQVFEDPSIETIREVAPEIAPLSDVERISEVAHEVAPAGEVSPIVEAAAEVQQASDGEAEVSPVAQAALADIEIASAIDEQGIQQVVPDEVTDWLEPPQFFENDWPPAGIDKDVWESFLSESKQVAQIVRDESEMVKESGVSFELMRAAHSLAGMSRIVTYPELETLAESVEKWAAFHLSNNIPPSEDSTFALMALSNEILHSVGSLHEDSAHNPNLDLAKQLTSFGSDDAGAESLDLINPSEEIAIHKAHSEELTSELLDDVVKPLESLEVGPVAEVEPEVTDVAEIGPVSEVDLLAIEHRQDSSQVVDPVEEVPLADRVEPVAHDEPESVQAPKPKVADALVKVNAPASGSGFDIDYSIHDDIDIALLPIVFEEAQEILSEMDKNIAEFDPGVSTFEDLNRNLHTLKGSARLCGMLRLGSMLHKMEDATMASNTISSGDAKNLVARVQSGLDKVRSMFTEAMTPVQTTDLIEIDKTKDDQSVLRIQSSKVQSIANLMGRIRITQDRVSRRSADGFDLMESMKSPLSRLSDLAQMIALEAEARMDDGSQRINSDGSFDALEMDRFTALHEHTRRMLEAVNDVDNIFQNTETVYQDIAEAIRRQVELSNAVQSGIDGITRSNLNSVESRLRAAVRQACEDCDKSCQLEIIGDIGIEREVVDKLVPAIEHMLRNSIAHGLESADVRRSLGKPANGTINISSKRDGSLVSITVSDDGAGIDFSKVQAKASQLGILKNSNPTEAELTEILFSAGFSTADTVSDVAGRGVGLDSVRDTVVKLGGRLSLNSVEGKGVSFVVVVPLSSGYVSGLLVACSEAPYIIPSALIKGVETLGDEKISKAIGYPGALVPTQDGVKKRLYSLASLFGVPYRLLQTPFHQLIVTYGHPDCLLLPDRMEYINNLPMRQVQPDMAFGVGVLGQVLLSDGRVAVVINPDQLLQAYASAGTEFIPIGEQAPAREFPLVLVVDDSITVRKVTARLLSKFGMRVETAENGAVALEKVSTLRPDVVLMDIEMPVMDGFDATRAIRSMPDFADLPIAIISSRNAEKHRDFAQSIGATQFFGKPYNEDELVEWINYEFKKAKEKGVAPQKEMLTPLSDFRPSTPAPLF